MAGKISKDQDLSILIAASGTGGHLFPAVEIAKQFTKQVPDCRIQFVGSGRPLEEIVIGGAGYKLSQLKTVGLKQRGLKGLLQFLVTLPAAFFKCWKLISDLKPDVIIGVGGYVTFLPITLGWLRSIPTWIHEAEAKPGLANYVLSSFASRVSLAVKETKMLRPSRAVFTGQPVREELVDIGSSEFNKVRPENLLILGGSQGAKALDQVMPELIPLLKDRGLRIWHQCRKENLEGLKTAYKSVDMDSQVMPFVENVSEAFIWTDIIISRAGAGAVREVGVVNKPTIFVPFPYAQGNHQLTNAKVLSDVGKAKIVEEGEDFSSKLFEALKCLLDKDAYLEMRNKPYQSESLGAAEKIVNGCLELKNKPLCSSDSSIEN